MLILALEATWGWIVLLLALGVLFAFAEIFIPSYGVLTGMAALSFIAAVVMGFFLGQAAGILTLLAAVLLTPLVIYLAIRVWPHTPIAKRIILAGPETTGKAGDLAHLEAGRLEGRVGVAKTRLRPAGKMTLDGRTLDCVTEGGLVDAGEKVRILAVHGARVVVRPVGEDEAEAPA